MIENNLEEKVMSEIKSGRVKLRSKYIFLAEKFGLGSAFVLSVLLAVLFFSLLLYYLRASDNLIYLSFGSRGFFVFLSSFPYLLIIALIVSIFVAGFIIKKNDSFYHKPFGLLAVCLVGLVLVFGSVLAFTNMAERIDRRASFLHSGMEERDRGIAGIIVDVEEDFVILRTPFGLKKVDLEYVKNGNLLEVRPGLFMVAVGERTPDVFVAFGFKVFSEDKMPMIRRGVERRFPPPLK